MVFVSIILLKLVGILAYDVVLVLKRYVLNYMPERSPSSA